jgi:SpoVK/Ycf46/Vps4 family AAA+-type ATPase
MPTKPRQNDDHMRQCAIWTARMLLAGVEQRGSVTRLADMDPDTRRLLGLRGREGDAAKVLTQVKLRLEALEPDKPARNGALFLNVNLLGDALGLSPVERDLLALAVMMASIDGVKETLWAGRPATWTQIQEILAAGLDVAVSEVRTALRSGSILLTTRLLRRGRLRFHEDPVELLDDFGDIMLEEHSTVDALVARLFRAAPQATLEIGQFPHVAEDVAMVVPLLKAACRERTVGFDVLLHGPPGTGKTELARVLAREVGVVLYEVNVEDEDGNSLEKEKRLAAWTMSQRMLVHNRSALVVFDEAEDVFQKPGSFAAMFGDDSGDTTASKGWMNRALETHAVPTIWISNAVAHIDPAYLRRFDMVVELRTPPPSVRRQVLDHHLGRLHVSTATRQTMAQDERMTPAHIERAARAVRLLDLTDEKETEAALDRLLAPQLDRVSPRRSESLMACGAYDLSLVNASMDVDTVAQALGRQPRGTLCLYGPSGTGKTAYVQHLAAATGRPLLQKRASELMSKYVGESEKAIAAMFCEARSQQSLLFLDEADSFLQDRSGAHHQWEVSLVNELLVQMEVFEGLFVCATNLVDSLDRAALRRFSLKIRFDALKPPQRWQMLEKTVAQLRGAMPEGQEADSLRLRLDRLDGVTAGDFATVARQQRILGAGAPADRLVATLEEEVGLKLGTTRRAAGFR